MRVQLASVRSFGHASRPAGVTFRPTDEDYLGGPKEMYVVTDVHGHYELGQLSPGSYSLLVWDPRSLAATKIEDVSAGMTDQKVTLKETESATAIRGRVVTPNGNPISDVFVFPERAWREDAEVRYLTGER